MKIVILTQDKAAIVDDADYEWFTQFEWCAHWTGHYWHAVRNNYNTTTAKTISMHRQIMSCPQGMTVDHIDHNTLNNQRCNLRICYQAENVRNQRKNKNNTSGAKGVYWNKPNKKWIGQIQFNRQPIYLGSFNSRIKAALAYDKAAQKYFGEFALTNF